jgi:hypothetical protein
MKTWQKQQYYVAIEGDILAITQLERAYSKWN